MDILEVVEEVLALSKEHQVDLVDLVEVVLDLEILWHHHRNDHIQEFQGLLIQEVEEVEAMVL